MLSHRERSVQGLSLHGRLFGILNYLVVQVFLLIGPISSNSSSMQYNLASQALDFHLSAV